MGYEALKDKSADAGLAFTTDARVKAYNLVVLQDDKHVFPVYNPSPLFRQDIINAYPQIPDQMKKLSSLLDTDTITGSERAGRCREAVCGTGCQGLPHLEGPYLTVIPVS